jgi:hypothetical protein
MDVYMILLLNPRIHSPDRFCCLCIRMHPHLAEIVTETRLENGAVVSD